MIEIVKKDKPVLPLSQKIELNSSSRAIAIWLLIGVGMIIIQVLIGGITRLTESGLSITEWKPITGMLPPLNEQAWQAEFDKYKVTDQFKYVHQHFTLSEFKSIFFWEWLHRVWARLMGIVFLAGFIYFLLKKKFKKEMIIPMVVLFMLGAVQGLIGWVMVKSGLVPEKYFVGHIELAAHFIAALGLLSYTLWFALELLIARNHVIVNPPLQKLLQAILFLLILQLVYGAFMAGLRAAIVAPTWPDINGKMIPAGMSEMLPFANNFINNPITIHFIHRGLAYLLFFTILAWWWKSNTLKGGLFMQLRFSVMFLVSLQIFLGILTVLNATYATRLIWLGVAHQFTAMLLVISIVCLLYLVRGGPKRRAG
ncbi:MAG: COX15/CtaA family protein [Ferruginibacter sp.]